MRRNGYHKQVNCFLLNCKYKYKHIRKSWNRPPCPSSIAHPHSNRTVFEYPIEQKISSRKSKLIRTYTLHSISSVTIITSRHLVRDKIKMSMQMDVGCAGVETEEGGRTHRAPEEVLFPLELHCGESVLRNTQAF